MTDPGATERLYRTEGDRLWRAVLAFAGDRAIADDSVAEAFAQALRRETSPSLDRWVWRVAFRVASGELKARGRFTRAVAEVPSHDPRDVSGSLLFALRSLPPGQRASVILRHYAGQAPGTIARTVGSPSLAVRVRLRRARAALGSALEASDDLEERFRSIDRVRGPDLWPAIVERTPARRIPGIRLR